MELMRIRLFVHVLTTENEDDSFCHYDSEIDNVYNMHRVVRLLCHNRKGVCSW